MRPLSYCEFYVYIPYSISIFVIISTWLWLLKAETCCIFDIKKTMICDWRFLDCLLYLSQRDVETEVWFIVAFKFLTCQIRQKCRKILKMEASKVQNSRLHYSYMAKQSMGALHASLPPPLRKWGFNTNVRLFYEITNRCSYMRSILFHC